MTTCPSNYLGHLGILISFVIRFVLPKLHAKWVQFSGVSGCGGGQLRDHEIVFKVQHRRDHSTG